MSDRPRLSAPKAPVPDLPSARPAVHRAAILAIVLFSVVMIVIDNSIVITGLPKIHAELGFSDAGLSWVTNAYALTFGGFLLLGARMGDVMGRRCMLAIGLAIFAASSLAIGFSPSASWLVAARAIQGLGAAVLAPSTLALLQTNFPAGPERTRAISFYAAAGGISASIGLVLGGLLAQALSWRVGFFINVPIGLGLILATFHFINETDRHSGTFDIAGAITSTLGMSSLVFGIVESAESGWTAPLTLRALIASAILLPAFVAIEWRARHPVMPLRLFSSRERSGAYVARILFLGANIGFFFFSTQLMQGVLGYGPALAGVAFLPAMIVNFVAALRAPRLIVRFGARMVLIGSLVLGMIGLAWLALDAGTSGYWTGLALPMILVGISQGGALGPLTSSGIAGVAAGDAGAAAGLVNAAHQIGGAFGLSLQIAFSVIGAGALTGRSLLAWRVGNAMGGAAAMELLAILVAFFAIPRFIPGIAPPPAER